ncbi:MAG: hypothetical protein M3380_20290, partial [Chloroflexota bacterium]|nr:hypothetical protein [Chloroflexota bacterium]
MSWRTITTGVVKHQPPAVADKERVRRGDSEIVHHLRPLLHLQVLHDAILAIRLAHVLAQLQVPCLDPAALPRVEG